MPKCPKCNAKIKHAEYTETIGGEYNFEVEEHMPNDDSDIVYTCPVCGKEISIDECAKA